MKILRNAIFVMVAIAVVLAFILVNYNKNTLVDDKNISSITIINNHMTSIKKLVGQAKDIEKKEDIKAICDAFNSAKYESIEKSKVEFLDGGGSYTFRFKYSSGITKDITYVDGLYIFIGDKSYKTDSAKFVEFWDLDYPIKDWHFNADGSYDENQ